MNKAQLNRIVRKYLKAKVAIELYESAWWDGKDRSNREYRQAWRNDETATILYHEESKGFSEALKAHQDYIYSIGQNLDLVEAMNRGAYKQVKELVSKTIK